MQSEFDLIDPDRIYYEFPCIQARQPVGDIFIAAIPYKTLIKISYFDVRRVLTEERDVERYLGIQRPLEKHRVEALTRYVNFQDASFPTSIILAIDEDYVSFNQNRKLMTVSNYRGDETAPSIAISKVARVIDGQHRIAGLAEFTGDAFDLTVTIFIGADISDQAQLFATVNLEQTKVNKSLVYDLFELAHSRSPQKTCHNIAVALDRDQDGPFFHRIKRLGIATEGRYFEPITQATFVEMLSAYITTDAKVDRDIMLRGKTLVKIGADELSKLPFRNMFIDEKDIEIGMIVSNFFDAVKKRWPEAWDFQGRGRVLNRTNGFRALMRFLRYAYLEVTQPGDVPSTQKFFDLSLRLIEMKDADFNVDNFPPGSAGEARLLRVLRRSERLPIAS